MNFWYITQAAMEGEARLWASRAVGTAALEIVETGLEFGLSESDIVKRLQEKLDIPAQKAKEYLNMFGKQTV